MEITKEYRNNHNKLVFTPDPSYSLATVSGTPKTTIIGSRNKTSIRETEVDEISSMSIFDFKGVLYAMSMAYLESSKASVQEKITTEDDHTVLMSGIVKRATRYYIDSSEIDPIVNYLELRNTCRFSDEEGNSGSSLPRQPIVPNNSGSMAIELINVA